MTTNNELEILTNSLKNTDNKKEIKLPSKKRIKYIPSTIKWYERSEYLHECYNTNELSQSPETWLEFKEWINCFDKEDIGSNDLILFISRIPPTDFMIKKKVRILLAEREIIEKRDFDRVWKEIIEKLEDFARSEEEANIYHEIEIKLRESFDVVSYKREVLVKIDNAYTNNLDKLLYRLNELAKEYKVSYRSVKGDVMESLKDSGTVDMDFFCYDSWLLNFKNGYYNFLDNKFIKTKNCKKEFIFSINRNYADGGVDCPIFKGALDVWLKNNNIIKRNDIFEFMAYSLMFGNFLKAFFLNVGDTNTGKTQIYEVLQDFVPTNNKLLVSLNRLTSDKFGTMGLNNKILIIFDDMSDKMIYDVSMIKTITGGASEIPVEYKHGAKVDTKNTGKIWQNGNYLPKIFNSSDSAYLDRAIIIKFLNPIDRYSENHKEQFHLTITKNKSEMKGIISELIKAGKRLYKRGNFRKEIKEYSKEHYIHESNEIFAFLKDYTIKNINASIPFSIAKDLVNKYRSDRKKPMYSPQEIKKEFEREGFYKTDTHIEGRKVWILKGLRWKKGQITQNIMDEFN